MNGKPIIGITIEVAHDPSNERTQGEIKLAWNYAQMIADAGGVPLVIPPQADAQAVAPLLDGWLIPGGADIDAARFGEDNHESVELQDPRRYELEQAIFHSVSEDLPILGICYGCQFLNVVRGGTLEQHIPDRAGTATHTDGVLDLAEIESGTTLGRIVGRAVQGKSYHHQAVDEVGAGLRVSARHPDGTVEAIEAVDRPWLVGVQWHPERTPEDDATRALFRAFVSAAMDFRASRQKAAVR